MSQSLAPPSALSTGTTPGTASQSPPVPAVPPSRSEVERKLSFKSAAPPKVGDLSKKKKPPTNQQGTDSDSSNAPLSPIISPSYPAGHLSPSSGLTSSAPGRGLSAIAERKSSGGPGSGEDVDDDAEEEVEGDEEGEGSGSEDEVRGEGGKELQRGMEGERVIKSGYLYKKQERRKAWKKKWFVLRTGKLAYYKDDREYSLSRVIDLHAIHTVAPVTVKKHSFTFGIVTSKRTFLAKASSQAEMDDWVSFINSARRKLSGDDKPPTPLATSTLTNSIAIPARQDASGEPAHQGTYTSVFSTTTQGSISASPIATTGYFASRSPTKSPPSLPGATLPPGTGSPMETANTLAAQMAMLSAGTLSQPIGSPAGSQPISRSVSARREESASSISSSAENFPRTAGSAPPAMIGGHASNLSPNQGGLAMVSSDEEEGEPYFSDPTAAFSPPGTSPIATTSMQTHLGASGTGGSMPDPSRVILSAYLMKRSKGRGRKVWRKRWFYLTSQGLTYTKSHMDSRPLRFIPLSSILDALDFTSAEGISSSDSEDDHPPFRQPSLSASIRPAGRSPSIRAPSHSLGGNSPAQASVSSSFPAPAGGINVSSNLPDRPTPQRQRTGNLLNDLGPGLGRRRDSKAEDQHTFKLVTAKRTYVLCAPSEEDEIKWLAAFRALLQRERQGSGVGVPGSGGAPLSPTMENAPRLPMPPPMGGQVPMITQQPPTPAPVGEGDVGMDLGETPASGMPSGPPVERFQGMVASPATSHLPSPVSDGTGTPVSAGGAGGGGGGVGNRGRSATFTAKSAVAEVVKRFHPERGEAVH